MTVRSALKPLGLAEILLGAALLISIMAIGAIHTVPMCLVSALVAASAIAILKQPSARSFSIPCVAMFALAIYSALQAVPMPIAWLRRLAPVNADVWADSLAPFGETVRYGSISLDPGASLLEALRWATYGLAFAVSAAIARKRGATNVVAMVFGVAVITAVVTLGHGFAGATKVFGIYQPTFGVPAWHLGPLLNANNLAGYMNLGIFCGLGLVMRREGRVPTWIIAPGVAALVAMEVLSGSRGGFVALALGVVCFVGYSIRRDGFGEQRRNLWLLAVVVVGGAAFAGLALTRPVKEELLDDSTDKIQMLSWSLPVIHDAFGFGIGRGAFESVFPAYRPVVGNIVYTHAENFALQWLDEWGVPVGAAALGVFAWAFRPSRLRAPSTALSAAVFAALIALTVQNMFDLAFEIPGVFLGMVVLLGAAHASRRRQPAKPLPSAAVRRWGLGAAIAALGVVACVANPSDVTGDRAAMHDRFTSHDSTLADARSEFRAELRTRMQRHPAEPYFPMLGAAEALRAGDEDPLPWIARSLERGTVNGEAHLLLAKVLMRRGAKIQALRELNTAASQDAYVALPAGELAATWGADFDEMLRAVPKGRAGVAMLDIMAVLFSTPENALLRSACDAEAIARDPTLGAARMRDAGLLFADIEAEPHRLGCGDRAYCVARIRAHAEALAEARPRSSMSTILRAKLLALDDKQLEAVELLARSCAGFEDSYPCQQTRVSLAARLKDGSALKSAVADLNAVGCPDGQTCASTMTFEGEVFTARGDLASAVSAYDRAVMEETTPERLSKLAAVASRAGEHVRALQALEKLATKRPDDEGVKRRLQEERAEIVLPK